MTDGGPTSSRRQRGRSDTGGHDGGERQECSPGRGSRVAVRVNQHDWQQERRARQRRVQHHRHRVRDKRRSRKRRGGTTGWRARLSRHTDRAPSGSASRTNAAPRNDAPLPASISPWLIEPRHSTPKIGLKNSRLPPRSGRSGRTWIASARAVAAIGAFRKKTLGREPPDGAPRLPRTKQREMRRWHGPWSDLD
jgi:hypothetical protein